MGVLLTISCESEDVLRIFLSISSFVVSTSDLVCRVARSTVIRRKSANLFSEAFPAAAVVDWAVNGPWGPTPFDEAPLDMTRACDPSSSLRDPSHAGDFESHRPMFTNGHGIRRVSLMICQRRVAHGVSRFIYRAG